MLKEPENELIDVSTNCSTTFVLKSDNNPKKEKRTISGVLLRISQFLIFIQFN